MSALEMTASKKLAPVDSKGFTLALFMCGAAKGGHVEIVKLCKEWGATDFNRVMKEAAWGGHVEIVKLCKEWGAVSYTHLTLPTKA